MSATMLHESARKTPSPAEPHGPTRAAPHTRTRPLAQRVARPLSILLPTLLGAILLGSWYYSTARGLAPNYELPSPSDVWSALWDGLTSGLFLKMAWVTLQESLGGFLLAMLIALPLGYSLTKWHLFAVTVQPYLAAGQAIPAIVIAPFLVLWMGYGIETMLILCMLVVLFPMIITTALGFATIDNSLREAARVEGASFWPMLARIEFPLALPAIMAAVRAGLTLSIIGALVGEFVMNADQGLGALVLIAKNQYNMPLMFATVVVLAGLAALLYGIAWGLTWLAETLLL